MVIGLQGSKKDKDGFVILYLIFFDQFSSAMLDETFQIKTEITIWYLA